MRTPPPADLPEGGTPAERLDMAFRKVLTVPKEALVREEAKEKRQREKKRGKKQHEQRGPSTFEGPGRWLYSKPLPPWRAAYRYIDQWFAPAH